MLDFLDTLAFQVDTDYRFFKFSQCVYNAKQDKLTSTFCYSENLGDKFSSLKKKLEQQFEKLVNLEINYGYEYKKSYTDVLLLSMEVKKFLTRDFGVLTLNFRDDDIKIEKRDNIFTINLYFQEQVLNYIKNSPVFKKFADNLRDTNFETFEFYFNIKETSEQDSKSALEKLDKYMQNTAQEPSAARVDKSLRVKNIEYWLGRPIRERPIKAEFLRVSQDEQITAGTMEFLTQREYKKGEETKNYWTFVLNDGRNRVNCVFFPSDKTRAKFEKLENGTVICVCGLFTERGGRTGLRITGVSWCELVK